jgi:succinate dehydrogenase flavin-adding protein (antitoxin of CptAB toxin-antitoxin module)
VEYLGHVSTPSRREKIEYPSRIEEIDEKDKIQKMYSNQNTNQINKKAVNYSNSILYTSNNYRIT